MTDPKPGTWVPCPPGEISRLSAWLRFRRRLWTAATVGGVTLAAAGTVGTTWVVYSAVTDTGTPAKHPRTRSSGTNRPPGSHSTDDKRSIPPKVGKENK